MVERQRQVMVWVPWRGYSMGCGPRELMAPELSRQISGNLRIPALSHGVHQQERRDLTEKDLECCSERDSLLPQTRAERLAYEKNVPKAGERATPNIRANHFLCLEFEGSVRDGQG